MKKLTQVVFENAPDWVKSCAVDSDGYAWLLQNAKKDLSIYTTFDGIEAFNGGRAWCIGKGYDTTDWQHSALDRE